MTSRIPPQNLEAEKALLGACVIEPDVISQVASLLAPADFYFDSHRKIFEAILALWNQQEPVDLITVSGLLAKTDPKISSADIAAAAENVLPFHAEAYARTVREAALRRKLLEAIRRAEDEIYSSADDSFSIAGRLGSSLAHLQGAGHKQFVHVSEVMTKVIKRIEKSHEEGQRIAGIPTGLGKLDTSTGGIQRGELCVIAGRPSMGKTALAIAMARGAAERGYGAVFITAESPNEKLGQRMLSAATGIENRDLHRPERIGIEQVRLLVSKATAIGNLPLWFLDGERSWDRIKAKVRAKKIREPGLTLALIDYVGLLSAPVPGGERYLEIGRISSEAKALAIELEIGVILLSQLNREVEGRADKRPKLSDLRESGNLEQDADVVGLLYRPSYYDPNFRPVEKAELDVAKNRDGETGVVALRFSKETVSFTDWSDTLPDWASERQEELYARLDP